jgi:hypothetical protein
MSNFLSHIDINNIPWSRPFSLVKSYKQEDEESRFSLSKAHKKQTSEDLKINGHDLWNKGGGIYEIGYMSFDR